MKVEPPQWGQCPSEEAPGAPLLSVPHEEGTVRRQLSVTQEEAPHQAADCAGALPSDVQPPKL